MTYVLLDNQYVTPAEQVALYDRCVRAGKLVSGLMRSAENRK